MEMPLLHVLVSPLDWGLGHATRCIPVVRSLLANGFRVSLSGYGRSAIVLRKEFPNLDFFELPGFSPSYSKNSNMIWKMLLSIPAFLAGWRKEKRLVRKLVEQQKVDIIISDNRYGVRSKKAFSILITHQLMLKVPGCLRFFEGFLHAVVIKFVQGFDAIWIPDFPEAPGLSGDLSHKYPLPNHACFVGPLSRFLSHTVEIHDFNKNSLLAILSGPEPQRSVFEHLIVKQLQLLDLPAVVVCGTPEYQNPRTEGKVVIYPHLPVNELETLIRHAKLVICRSGYSTIMDLTVIGAKAFFVPTPGQTEQTYLAEMHMKAGNALSNKQEGLDLKTDIPEATKYKGLSQIIENETLNNVVKNLRFRKCIASDL